MAAPGSENLRWFTASAVAGIDARGGLHFESSPYLGVDAQGYIAARQACRPEQVSIIHDLGQALLLPLGTRRFPATMWEKPRESGSWLAQQRQAGIGAIMISPQCSVPEISAQALSLGLRLLCDENPASRVPEGPAWEHSYALTRSIEPQSGTLTLGARFDVTVLCLDHPHLRGLSLQELHAKVRDSQSYLGVRELWIGGWRVMV